MSTDSSSSRRSLPDRPHLRHLKDQARDLVRSGGAGSITDAQFQIARLYGFSSWPTLKAHVDALSAMPELEQAAETEDVGRLASLMGRHPALQAIVDRLHGAGTWLKMKAYVAAQGPSERTESGQLVSNHVEPRKSGPGT